MSTEPPITPRAYTVADIAVALRAGVRTIQGLAARRALPGRFVVSKRMVRYKASTIDAWIEAGCVQPADEWEQSRTEAAAADCSQTDIATRRNVPALAEKGNEPVQQTFYQNCTFSPGGHSVKNINVTGPLNVGRDLVVADVIRNSFNIFNSSDADGDIKDEFKRLSEAAAAMCEQLSPEQAAEAARHFNALATEATKPTPRRTWLKAAADGLLTAAKTAGAAAVTGCVSAIIRYYLTT